MASTDAKPVPIKNAAYRVTFPIYDADGDLVTGAASLDSEVSKDGGTFADCTNEATEIATSSGMYYLDLTSTEMNADTVAIIVKTSTSGAKTTVIVLNPQEAGDIKIDVESISGDTTAADNAEAFFDGTGYAGTNNVIPTVTTLTNAPSDSSGTTTLLSRVTSTRAGYLDNLSGGAVALASALSTVAGYLDTEIAAILEDTGTTIPTQIAALSIPTASANASAVRTELATELARIDVAISTRLASGSYTAPLDAAAVRTAVGLASANLDTQLGDIPTVSEFNARTLVAASYATASSVSGLDTKIGTPASLSGSPATISDNLVEIHSDGQTTAGIVTTQGSVSLATILADTAELQTDWANGGRLDLILDAIAANVVLVLADTGTDGVVLSAATCNKIADHVRRRTQANVEASSDGDTLSLGSEYGAIQQMQEAAVSGSTLTVKKTDGSTTLGTKTLTSDAAAEPITGVS